MGVGVWVGFGGLCSYVSDGEERSGRMVTRVKGWRVGFVVLEATQD
jgi:sugar phosphate permease